MPDIIHTLTSIRSGPSSAGVAAMQGPTVTGNYRGQRVMVAPSLTSLIDDAMEELTALAGEKAEEKEKLKHEALSRPSNIREHKDRVEKVQAVMDHIRGFAVAEKIKTLRERVQDGKNEMRLADLSAWAEDIAGDVSERYLVLKGLHKELAGSSPDAAALADRAASNILRESGPMVRAGLNIAPRAMDVAAGDPDRSGQLRDLYRDHVVGYQGLVKAYDALVDHFGTDHIDQGADFLISAAGDDLAAYDPSMDKAQLKNTIDELFELHTLVTIHNQARQMIGRIRRMNDIFHDVTPLSITRHLLDLTTKEWPDSGLVLTFVERLGARDPGAQINVVRELRDIAGLLPLKLFADNDERTRLIDIFRQAQDIADEREADALGG